MKAKEEEMTTRRTINIGTADVNKQLAEEKRLAELQEKVRWCVCVCVFKGRLAYLI